MNKNSLKAITVLKKGGIVLLPTDTVFGLCCRIDRNDSLKRLFSLKKRDLSQAVPILVSSIEMVREYVLPFSEKVEELMEKYWPGGLTIVLKAEKEKVLPLVRGDEETIGIRIPNYPELREIINEVGVPIVGTSANFHGGFSVAKYKDLDPNLVKLVDFTLPEDSLGGVASTVIDCSSDPWKILREGAVAVKL